MRLGISVFRECDQVALESHHDHTPTLISVLQYCSITLHPCLLRRGTVLPRRGLRRRMRHAPILTPSLPYEAMPLSPLCPLLSPPWSSIYSANDERRYDRCTTTSTLFTLLSVLVVVESTRAFHVTQCTMAGSRDR